MGYGLDISSSLSMLVGLAGSENNFRVRHAVVLPGFESDREKKPEDHTVSLLGGTWGGLKTLGIRPGAPAALIPGSDVYYRFAHTGTNPKVIEAQVRLEADDIAGDAGGIQADYLSGCDFEYAPAIHVALAREEILDHYAGSLAAAGVEVDALIPGCVALFQAYRISGDLDSEYVTMHVNVGEDATDIILAREGSLLFARAVSVGVKEFIHALTPDYGRDEDALRQILFRRVDLKPSIAADNLDGDRGVEAAQEVASRLFQQIQTSVTLAQGAMRAPSLDIRKIMLSGPGAAIPGLRELMMNRLRKTVEIFNPFERISLEGLNDKSRETIESYRPALTLAVGLAALATDTKLERAQFLPATTRRRREFLHKSLFLYLAAALVVAVVLPLYILTARAADSEADALKQRQQAPIGRYQSASAEIESLKEAEKRAWKRADAAMIATDPGRVATEILVEFARRRPDPIRLQAVELVTDPGVPGRDQDARPSTNLRFQFFIERQAGVDPNQLNMELREIISRLPGVARVIPGAPQDNAEAPGVASGVNVTHTVRLKIGEAP